MFVRQTSAAPEAVLSGWPDRNARPMLISLQ
jgi:hypothetical protein